jgi:hypothetical protein
MTCQHRFKLRGRSPNPLESFSLVGRKQRYKALKVQDGRKLDLGIQDGFVSRLGEDYIYLKANGQR